MVSPLFFRQGNAERREDLEFEVLSLLESEPGISQRELGRQLGVSLGRMNACINAMMAAGLVSAAGQPPARSGGGHAYRVTPAGRERWQALAEAYLERKDRQLGSLAARVQQLRREVALAKGRKP